MDSGSAEILGPPALVPKSRRRETELSKNGLGYRAADGGKIKNLGEGEVEAMSEDGIPLKYTAQIGDNVSRLLIGLSRAAAAGNAVLFNVDRDFLQKMARENDVGPNLIVDKKTMIKGKIEEKDGIYTYPMWIKKHEENPKTASSGISGAKYFHAGMVEEDVEDEWGLF